MKAQISPNSVFYPRPLNPHSLPYKPFSRILNLSGENPPKRNFSKIRKLVKSEPLWPVAPTPPPCPSGIPFDHQVNHSGIPFSLRLVQLKRKEEKLARTTPVVDPEKLGPACNAVWTLATMLESLHKSALPVDDEAILYRASREGRCSVVCLFQRLFLSSPKIALQLLVMMAEFMVRSVGSETRIESEERGDGHRCLKSEENELCADYAKTKSFYEHLIVKGEGDSLILANYAEFLYLFENDLDRANDYFNLAVNTEPMDWEAMSRYAFFLWHVRGDIERAEEMLLEAIQAHPDDDEYYQCYAQFLNETGCDDTCYPFRNCTIDEDDDKLSGL